MTKTNKGIARAMALLLTLIVPVLFVPRLAAGVSFPALSSRASLLPTVTLHAASGATIAYRTQNGVTLDGVLPQVHDVPHLVLYRNGALTPTGERTLVLEVADIVVPTTGVTVTVKIGTQHQDPDVDSETGSWFSVWQASQRLAWQRYAPKRALRALFVHEFTPSFPSGTESVAMPTDYFRYQVTVTDASDPAANSLYTVSREYAFLMENQWIAQLPEVHEASPGAAPDELVVYYCDMFPFRRDAADPSTWLAREDVTDYVGAELLPRMVEAFYVQTNVWGFPWYRAWTSLRREDGERLSLALGEGETWFHGRAPARGRSDMSITVSGGYAPYDTLTDGLMEGFHHELFHNHQRNMHLHQSRPGWWGERDGAWEFFTEGTATLAASVGQPSVEFASAKRVRNYVGLVNQFLGSGDPRFRYLPTSHPVTDPYSVAIYWRFLYEQCGGMENGIEDTVAGMHVIRRALTVLYSEAVTGLGSSTDLAGDTAEILDRALSGSLCPFQTYDESLIAFARALYALRLEDGRCIEPGTPDGCGFFDPHHQYREPSVLTIVYNGDPVEIEHEMMSSFGIDLLEVAFSPAAEGHPLVLEFYASSQTGADLDVQILQLADSFKRGRPKRTPVPSAVTKTRAHRTSDGRLIYVIPRIQRAASQGLGLIVTRRDAQETASSTGEYAIVLADHSTLVQSGEQIVARDVHTERGATEVLTENPAYYSLFCSSRRAGTWSRSQITHPISIPSGHGRQCWQ